MTRSLHTSALVVVIAALLVAAPQVGATEGGPAANPTPSRTAPDNPIQMPIDKRAPRLLLTGATRQRMAQRMGFYATCSEHCEFAAEARVYRVAGVRSVKVYTPAKASNGGRRVRFEIKITGRARALIAHAFRRHARPFVSVEVSAIDLAENETRRTLVIKVVPR